MTDTSVLSLEDRMDMEVAAEYGRTFKALERSKNPALRARLATLEGALYDIAARQRERREEARRKVLQADHRTRMFRN